MSTNHSSSSSSSSDEERGASENVTLTPLVLFSGAQKLTKKLLTISLTIFLLTEIVKLNKIQGRSHALAWGFNTHQLYF